jgi:hypothetical protein
VETPDKIGLGPLAVERVGVTSIVEMMVKSQLSGLHMCGGDL